MSTTASAAHFLEIKKEIADSYPDFQERATTSWSEILEELSKTTEIIKNGGSNYIPQVKFSDLDILSEGALADIKRKGCIVVKDVVDDEQAKSWKNALDDFVKANPDVDGHPADDKQFFQLYWTKPQVEARAHPNMLTVSTWLNNLYHTTPGQDISGVDLSTPLSYADRFRIRHPGGDWNIHPPHVDGGSIERWEDPTFRSCFDDIFRGNWRQHDAFALGGRITARHSMYRRPNQASIFRSFQGWLSMGETGPSLGTLKVFPDILLSNAYLILRPFFRPLVPADSPEVFDAKNWTFDISFAEFPGLKETTGGWHGPRPTPELHPHMRLEETMISMPNVSPGDTVWWHCDMVHAVEREHTGTTDSAVMYIPAMPLTPNNKAYIDVQRESFIQGVHPPDYPPSKDEKNFIGTGKPTDITNLLGKQAMGFPILIT